MRAFQGVYTVSITAKNVLNTVAPTGFFLLLFFFFLGTAKAQAKHPVSSWLVNPGLTSS